MARSLTSPPAAEPVPKLEYQSPPFLVWPVSQQEFYRTLCLALLPSLAWGINLFGIRTLAMLLSSLGAMSFTYLLVTRWLKWRHGKPLLYIHCLLSALVLVALAHPT